MNNISALRPHKPAKFDKFFNIVLIKSSPFHDLSIDCLFRCEYAEKAHDTLLLRRQVGKTIQLDNTFLDSQILIMCSIQFGLTHLEEPLLLKLSQEHIQCVKRSIRRLRKQLHEQCMPLDGFRINDSFCILKILSLLISLIVSVKHVDS